METDKTDIARFLEAVWGHGPHSLCWQVPGGRFQYLFVDTPADILADIDNLQIADVWFGAHPLKGRPASGRGGIEDIVEVVSIPADLDWADPSRKTDDILPSERELRSRLAAVGFELQPSIVINSGHGLQTWWLLGEPMTPGEGAVLLYRFGLLLESVGLTNGRPDLASIMRLPGTLNHKGVPVPARFE